MYYASWPSESAVRSALERVARAGFTHPHEGYTRDRIESAPEGYVLDRYGCALGEGHAVFEAAARALRDFSHYPAGFTGVVTRAGAFEPGLVFGTLARHFGFVSMNPCRIAFVVDEPGAGRFGFGIGTLPGHAAAGEERFLVEVEPESGVVRYEVQAISRPALRLTGLFRPAMRRVQRRFQRESMASMKEIARVAA